MIAAMAGCEDLGDDGGGVDFINASFWVVTVSPDGQSGWSQFVIDQNESRNIDIGEDVRFTYRPAGEVYADTSEDGEVVFRNR